MAERRAIVEALGIVNRFGSQVVHDHLDMQVLENEVFGIVGGSGTGKSVLLRTILGLQKPQEGIIRLEGWDITKLGEAELRAVDPRLDSLRNLNTPEEYESALREIE